METIDLFGLQTLNLCFLYPLTYRLCTPNLHTLSLRIQFSGSHEEDTAAWSLIPRVPPSVTHLTLNLDVDDPTQALKFKLKAHSMISPPSETMPTMSNI
ncbi:hypothetical protein ONZ45_g3458 [Pleurotus djamor]|nr:hypothetical protein ONZ45_g3458 [Pleurotus djamor]